MSQGDAAESPNHWGSIRESALEILNVRREVRSRESNAAAFVERIGWALARPTFFLAVLGSHVLWILLNLPIHPWWQPWDPYPFMFLATFASVEAPLLALLVLMHQQREQRINELREETSLQVSLHVERQVTLVLRLVRELQEHGAVRTQQDPALLERMQQYMDPQELIGTLEHDLEETEGSGATTA